MDTHGQPRRHGKSDLRFRPQDAPLSAITPVTDHEQPRPIRLTSLTATNATARATAGLLETLQRGAHYWLEMSLPGAGGPLELIVQLTTIETLTRDELKLGFAVCAGDDGTRIIDALERATRRLAPQNRGGSTATATEPEGAAC